MTESHGPGGESGPLHISRAEMDEDLPIEIDEIDLERLAEAVLSLLKDQLRVERERLGSRRDWH